MKIEEILGGRGKIALPVSNEESSLIDKIKDSGQIDKKTLNEREKNLVDLLIRRDIVYMNGNNVMFNELSGPEF